MAIIDKPSDYFNTKLYTGDGDTASNKTGVGFQPDFTWIKKRTDDAEDHALFDSVRGVSSPKLLNSNGSGAEETHGNNGYLSGFLSDGFSVATNGTNSEKWEYLNTSGDTFASWNWKAGGTASSNTDGSITSSVSANQDAGFSIVKYNSTRTPSAVQTVGHGLGVSPDVLIFKNLNETQNWLVWHKDIATNQHLNLNTTSALSTDAGSLNNTAPTSSVFTIGGDGRTNSTTEGNPIVCYAFAEKSGYSSMGSYTGNGSATNGTFIYTGFKPAFVMSKYTTGGSAGGEGWNMFDNKRDAFNIVDLRVQANSSSAESSSTNHYHDFLSNGFKLRTVDGSANNSGATYIYMAFAENPFVTSTGVPATAR
jgi:hypothetical protein